MFTVYLLSCGWRETVDSGRRCDLRVFMNYDRSLALLLLPERRCRTVCYDDTTPADNSWARYSITFFFFNLKIRWLCTLAVVCFLTKLAIPVKLQSRWVWTREQSGFIRCLLTVRFFSLGHNYYVGHAVTGSGFIRFLLTVRFYSLGHNYTPWLVLSLSQGLGLCLSDSTSILCSVVSHLNSVTRYLLLWVHKKLMCRWVLTDRQRLANQYAQTRQTAISRTVQKYFLSENSSR